MNIEKIKITSDLNCRIDKFLFGHFNKFSRSFIQSWLKSGKVKVNNKVVKPSYILKENDDIEIEIPIPQDSDLEPNYDTIPFEIVYEDSHLAIINKPPNLVVHPGKGTGNNTLAHYLKGYFGNLSEVNGKFRPGIIHRLDKDTSGLLIVAKTNEAHYGLVNQQQQRKIKKYYLALLLGVLSSEKAVDVPLGKSFKDRVKIVVNGINAKYAKTIFRPINVFGNVATLAEAELITGRTHQIRVHAQHIGLPIFGDPIYTLNNLEYMNISKLELDIIRQAKKLINRQALHAFKLQLFHPITNKFLEFKIDLPHDMQKVIDFFEKKVKERNL